jgi:putative methyltransferase (TIGR04325 family)
MKSRLRMAARVAVARYRSRLSGSFTNHDSALNDCAQSGYANSNIVDVVSEKTRRMVACLQKGEGSIGTDEAAFILYGALQAAARGRNRVCVLDHGGAFGIHYYRARRWLPSDLPLGWAVVETQPMVAAANANPRPGELTFHASLNLALAEIGEPDLVYSSNAIQYMPNPMVTLGELLAPGSRIVCLSKLVMADIDRVIYTRQQSWLSENGPGPVMPGFEDAKVAYPLAILPRNATRELMRSRYDLLLHYVHPNVLHHADCGLVEYHSFIASLKAEPR